MTNSLLIAFIFYFEIFNFPFDLMAMKKLMEKLMEIEKKWWEKNITKLFTVWGDDDGDVDGDVDDNEFPESSDKRFWTEMLFMIFNLKYQKKGK